MPVEHVYTGSPARNGVSFPKANHVPSLASPPPSHVRRRSADRPEAFFNTFPLARKEHRITMQVHSPCATRIFQIYRRRSCTAFDPVPRNTPTRVVRVSTRVTRREKNRILTDVQQRKRLTLGPSTSTRWRTCAIFVLPSTVAVSLLRPSLRNRHAIPASSPSYARFLR